MRVSNVSQRRLVTRTPADRCYSGCSQPPRYGSIPTPGGISLNIAGLAKGRARGRAGQQNSRTSAKSTRSLHVGSLASAVDDGRCIHVSSGRNVDPGRTPRSSYPLELGGWPRLEPTGVRALPTRSSVGKQMRTQPIGGVCWKDQILERIQPCWRPVGRRRSLAWARRKLAVLAGPLACHRSSRSSTHNVSEGTDLSGAMPSFAPASLR